MHITLQLFGRFRDFSDAPEVALDLPDIRTLADFRLAFEAWAQANWPTYPPGLLRSTALATEAEILTASSPLPADGKLAVLPPVSGG